MVLSSLREESQIADFRSQIFESGIGHTPRLFDGQVFEALRAYPRIIVAGIRLIQSATFLFSNENRRQAFGAQTVALEYSIMSDKAQFFDTGLSYEHSIEWIAVDVLQSTDSDGVWHSDR